MLNLLKKKIQDKILLIKDKQKTSAFSEEMEYMVMELSCVIDMIDKTFDNNSRNKWHINKELHEIYKNKIIQYIEELEKDTEHQLTLELGKCSINPYQVGEILQELGYDWEHEDENGWEQDTWYLATKKGYKPLTIEYSGHIFDLKIYCKWNTGGYQDEENEYNLMKGNEIKK